jgi:hypothetical protein
VGGGGGDGDGGGGSGNGGGNGGGGGGGAEGDRYTELGGLDWLIAKLIPAGVATSATAARPRNTFPLSDKPLQH